MCKGATRLSGKKPKRRARKETHSYTDLRRAAMRLLKNKPVRELIEAALHNEQIWVALRKENPGQWERKSSVSTAMRTEADRAQADLPVGDPVLTPQRWLAEDIAYLIEIASLRLRTAKEAQDQLNELAESVRSKNHSWPCGVHEAASQAFLRALTSVDETSGLARVDLLLFHSSQTSVRSLDLENDPTLNDQFLAYQAVWRNLFDAYSRQLAENVKLRDLLEVLEALEDGYLAKAAGMGSEYENRCANNFGHGVVAVLEGMTLEKS